MKRISFVLAATAALPCGADAFPYSFSTELAAAVSYGQLNGRDPDNYASIAQVMARHFSKSPELKSYRPRAERTDDGDVISFKIVLSELPVTECSGLLKAMRDGTTIFRDIVVNGQSAKSRETTCVNVNTVQVYAAP